MLSIKHKYNQFYRTWIKEINIFSKLFILKMFEPGCRFDLLQPQKHEWVEHWCLEMKLQLRVDSPLHQKDGGWFDSTWTPPVFVTFPEATSSIDEVPRLSFVSSLLRVSSTSWIQWEITRQTGSCGFTCSVQHGANSSPATCHQYTQHTQHTQHMLTT